MKRLIFHMGLPRTGTTSIQAFLAERRGALAAHGILYPTPSGATPHHRNFASEALNRDPARAINHVALAMELLDTDRNLTDRSGPLPEWGAALDRMEREPFTTLLVSYENFGLTPRKYDLQPLAARLAGYHRTGVLFLRHPQDWLVSLYEQHIRGKRRGGDAFAEFGQFARAGGLTSAKRLQAARSAFALDALVPLDFTQAVRDAGLVPSFLAAAGIADALAPAATAHRNAAAPAWQSLFLRELNRLGASDRTFVWVRQSLTNCVRDGVALVDLAPGLDVLTPEERSALAMVAAADVRELAAKHGLMLAGPKAAPVGAYRAFADGDRRAVAAALRTDPAVRPKIPAAVAAELAALAG